MTRAGLDLDRSMQGICAYSQSLTTSWYRFSQSTRTLKITVAEWIRETKKLCIGNSDLELHLDTYHQKHPVSTLRSLHAVLRRRLDRKVLFGTQRGLYGLASQQIKMDGRAELFASCRVPIIMRPDGGNWRLTAHMYVYEAMRGGSWEGDDNSQPFTFV